MKSILRQSIATLIFWLFIFFICRIIFYCGIYFLLSGVSFSLISASFFHALRLDLSMIGYLMLVPVLLLTIFAFFNRRFLLTVHDGYMALMIILYTATATGEMCLYREWKAKLSMQALAHFANPSEVFRSSSGALTLLFFSVTIIFSWLYIRLYMKKLSLRKNENTKAQPGPFGSGAITYFASGILICGLGIRGGSQQIPIQSSDAFFCNEPVVNDAAVNPMWNLAYNVIDYENHFKENPYKDYPQEEADRITRSLLTPEKDSTEIFLQKKDPNIVFIILESWSAWCVKSFNGDNFAPFTDSLSREGIRMTNFYPAGYVSDQGIPAILSGYPCTSRISVINQSSKSAKLPCISRDLEKHGYQSGFIFGGDLNYGNIRSYIYNEKFDVVKEERDFESAIPRGKLGIQDGYMSDEYLKMLNQARAPFIYSWFTLSSHMPYDFPGEKKDLTAMENDYTNSVMYADNALRQFFEKAKHQSWYQNTLFIIVADHSHGSHKDFSVYDPEYHRIPMFFYGDVIRPEFRGKNIEKVNSQVDIAPTLLCQLGFKAEAAQYSWGANIFNPYKKPFAYYCNFSGGGAVSSEGYVAYQHDLKKPVFNTMKGGEKAGDSLAALGRAFQQSVYEDYRLK